MYKIYTRYMDMPIFRCAKIMLIMRLTTVILLACFMQVSASTFGQKITLTQKKASLEAVLREIRNQSGYDFFYDGKILPAGKTINISIQNSDIDHALNAVLKGLPLSYKIDGKIVSIRKKEEPSFLDRLRAKFAEIDVRGRITDANGMALAGATVSVKGKKQKVNTNDNGEFYLPHVDENATIEISYIGYEVREIKVTENVGNIPLELSSSDLDEVEITYSTGYQQLSRERSAGSFAKPNLDAMKNRSSSLSILQRLDGLVPGLTVNNAPDAVANPFLIRGLTSINSTRSPLIVVDGVELQGASINSINMQDVADITILKDATSASIWGSKAANGVIVITTKKGRPGEKLKIEYDAYYNFQGRPDRAYVRRMNSEEFIATAKELFPQFKPSNPYSAVEAQSAVPEHLRIQYAVPGSMTQQQADAALDQLATINNRSQISDLIYRNAVTSNHTLSLSGGGPVHSFYGSVNYIGVKNNTPGDKDERYKVNLRQDFTLSKRLQVFLITDINKSTTGANNIRSLTEANDLLTTPLEINFVPYQLLQDANGNPLTVNAMGNYGDSQRLDYQERSGINLDYVPLNEINAGYSQGSALSARIVGGVKLNLLKGLRFEGTYGYNVNSENTRTVLDQQSYAVRNEVMRFTQPAEDNGLPVYWVPKDGGRLTETNSLLKNWTVRNQLVYDLDWGQHELTVLGGQEAMNTTPLSTTAIYRGWDDQLQISRPVDYAALARGINNTIMGYTMTLPNNLSGGEGVISRTTSYYSNLSYSFKRKYSFNGSIRIDQSNLFGLDKSAQNRPVYSLGGKWALGSEDFMKSQSFFNRLDARLTYGVTGNAPTAGLAASRDVLAAEAEANYPTGAGLIISAPANDKLTWEGTVVYNAGIDFGILGGRLGGSIDAYLKKTQDLIGVLGTSALTGYSGVTGNFGDMENKGIELSLNSINLTSANFLWTSGFTFGYNKNKITKLAVTTPITTGEGMVNADYVVGYPAFTLFGYNYAGLNASGDPQVFLSDGTISAASTGTLAADAVYLGTAQPVWSGGFSNSFQYKDFQLGINISYSGGNTLFRDVNGFYSGVLYANPNPDLASRWKVQGDEAKTDIPKYVGNQFLSNQRNTSYYIYANSNKIDASFVKLRDITLSYSLPKNLVRHIRAQAISFRCQVSNLMLWKANDFGIDPEFQTSRASRTIRTGQGQVTFGAHITL